MDFLELKDISERYLELLNPTSAEKVLAVGRALGLQTGDRVIDFGCGVGEVLALWGETFGIVGLGIDVRESACRRARDKMAQRDLDDHIEIVCAHGAEYAFEERAFDVASCIGATFIWGSYRATIRSMTPALRISGQLVVGEPYWRKPEVPPGYAVRETFHTEYELLQIARDEGYDVKYVARASQDDWDRYEAGNWYGLIDWIEANPDHPERQEVIDHLHQSQDEYVRYGREYLGWAMYVLTPVTY